MPVSYDKLWKLLVDRKMTPADLRKQAGFTSNTLTKLYKDELVSSAILVRICEILDVDFSDIIEYKKGEQNEF